MKKSSLILGLLCLGLTLSAQPGIVSTREANDQSGKVLTMEETILSRELSPENLGCMWLSADEIVINKDGKWQLWNISADTYSDYTPSSDKKMQAYVKEQSLYLRDNEGNEKLIAESEDKNITYGQFVSRNEFGIDGGIFWAPDSSKVAFYRKDESKVTSFPLLDITTRTGSLMEIKYPMAGMDSENVQLWIYDLASGETTKIEGGDYGYDTYLTNITWAPDGSKIYIQVLDRSQKHMKLNAYDAENGQVISTILTEDNDRYVEPLDPLYFIEGSNNIFLYRTANRDGYRNLYLCDNAGNVRRLTAVDADVAYIGNDGQYVYYTSAEVSPVENHLFRIEVKNVRKGVAKTVFGKPQRLTQESGWHDVSFSPDCKMFVDSWSNISTPRVADLCSADGKTIRNLLTAGDPTLDYAYTEISLGTVRSADGQYDNYYRLIKPKDFDPSKKYPVIVYVYGGPHSQMVQNTYLAQLRRWEMYMAQRGYLVYDQGYVRALRRRYLHAHRWCKSQERKRLPCFLQDHLLRRQLDGEARDDRRWRL